MQNCVSYKNHPYSHIEFDGYPVPEFEKCLDVVREIAYYEPAGRYVGWDVAVTPDGIEIIEGNIPPGEVITQVCTGCGIKNMMQQWK